MSDTVDTGRGNTWFSNGAASGLRAIARHRGWSDNQLLSVLLDAVESREFSDLGDLLEEAVLELVTPAGEQEERLSAGDIVKLAKDYESIPLGVSVAGTAQRKTIEDALVVADPLVTAIHAVRFYSYLSHAWTQSTFLRSLELRAGAR